jgi:triacylglycerol lipase
MSTAEVPVPVLLHGFLGFRRLGPIRYFRGLERALRARGIEALFPEVPCAGSVSDRAKALATILNRNRARAFVLVGHSMGGLDGRFLITHLDPDRRVKALVTVATPHRGSPAAQRALDGEGPLAAIGRRYWRSALRDLTPQTRAREPIADRPGVAYASYAASRPPGEIPGWMRWVTGPLDGENDGVVPATSAQWGTVREPVRADHVELVGWSLGLPSREAARPFDHLNFWLRVVSEAMTMGAEDANTEREA